MCCASRSRLPSAPDRPTRSEPARSTRFSFPGGHTATPPRRRQRPAPAWPRARRAPPCRRGLGPWHPPVVRSPVLRSRPRTVTMRRAWERELCSFRLVHSVTRLMWPNSKTWGSPGRRGGETSPPHGHQVPRGPGDTDLSRSRGGRRLSALGLGDAAEAAGDRQGTAVTAGSLLIPWECRGPTLLFLPPCSSPHGAVTATPHPGTYFGLCCSPALQKHSRTRGVPRQRPCHTNRVPSATLPPPPVSPHLVDVLHALHRELGEPGHVELPAAVGAQLDLQLLLRLLPQQVPAPRGARHPPRLGAGAGLRAGGVLHALVTDPSPPAPPQPGPCSQPRSSAPFLVPVTHVDALPALPRPRLGRGGKYFSCFQFPVRDF